MKALRAVDSAFNNQFPSGYDAYFGYVDGRIGDQPNYSWIVANFPHAFHLSITVLGNDADCLDIESGAATVAGAARWYAGRKKAGVQRPVFYASASLMNSELIPALKAAGLSRSAYRLWSAHYTTKHICGPSSCGQLSIFADGTQWTDHDNKLTCDQSLLIPSFFSGITPPDPVIYIPQAETDAIMGKLPVLKQGASDTALPHWYVHRIQAVLNAVWHAGLTVDGEYGPATAAAVSAMQGASGIKPDGVMGPATWSILVTGV